MFRGYEPRDHQPDPNEHAFLPGGWLRTGDKGKFDQKGHLHLTGRFKEVINRAGEKISPLAVEHALIALVCTRHLSYIRKHAVFKHLCACCLSTIVAAVDRRLQRICLGFMGC